MKFASMCMPYDYTFDHSCRFLPGRSEHTLGRMLTSYLMIAYTCVHANTHIHIHFLMALQEMDGEGMLQICTGSGWSPAQMPSN
jgi:hypothetical protein